MIQHHPAVKEALEKDDLAFGTVDSWIIYVSRANLRKVAKVDADMSVYRTLPRPHPNLAYISQTPATHPAPFSSTCTPSSGPTLSFSSSA